MVDGLHVAVVGYGQIARSHTRILAGEGHHLDWLIGRVPERTAAFAAEHGYARHGTSLEEALRDPAVEAVVLCTPSEQHAAQTAACLAAGKHVLVEIPLAMSYIEGRGLAETARRKGLTLMVAHTHRYGGAVRRARERIESGQLTLLSATARYMFLRRENVGASGYVRSWTDNLLWHHGQHATDLVLWLLGVDAPGQVEVNALLAPPDAHLGIPLDLSLVMRTAKGQIGTVAMSYNSHVSVYDYVLVGAEDTLLIEQGVLRNRDGVLYDPRSDESDERNSGVLQDREFVAAVRAGRPTAIDASAVLPALEVLQRAQDAYDAGAAGGARGAPPAGR
ncbi:MAG TPA: Gfo/Idh/MocA family oxidoreductase [Chloroflexota bacterium]|jgi:2-hydroxy-4-carboxymuconate semialdehyde hemiacetal dehydrogenase|nr:Gfo/Idh/MocA family oxidoreductase [Chloroflexota bacterium]